jgi:hypothetical protein
MSRTSFLRRAIVPTVVAGAATAAIIAAAVPAGAVTRPGVTTSTYQLTPKESWNVCGGSDAVIHFPDENGTSMTVNCGTGLVSIYTVW